jgi:hypothetical protein
MSNFSIGTVVDVHKIEFNSELDAECAGHILDVNNYTNAVLGSALIVPVTRHNKLLLNDVVSQLNGTVCNDKLSFFDLSKVL